MKGERIVELCSAANAPEAHALCALLEEAGIPFRIVGEFLGAAAGSLPFGEATAPRIWVWEQDAARAREILGEERSPPTEDEALESVEEYDSEDVPDGEDAPLPSDVRFRWLSQGFVIVGAVCIVAGAIWAWFNWMTMQQYSGTAEGVPVSSVKVNYSGKSPLPPEVPLHGERSRWVRYNVKVAYVVDGKTYGAIVRDWNSLPDSVPIHYDPRHPDSHITGSLTPPWVILLFALAIGAFLSFVGYQFR